MGGWPVWLASISKWKKGPEVVPVEKWRAETLLVAEKRLEEVLWGIGDQSRERCFRMNVTLCRHRALSKNEGAHVMGMWKAFGLPPRHMAGGPIEVLWMKGIKDTPSTRPCANPTRKPLDVKGNVWMPIDCEECESCLARLECHEGVEIIEL